MSCINMYLIMETKGPVSLMPPAKNININHERGRAIVIRTSSNAVSRESSMVSRLCVVPLFVISTRFLPSTSVMPVAEVMSLNAKETRMRRLDSVKIRRGTRFFCKNTMKYNEERQKTRKRQTLGESPKMRGRGRAGSASPSSSILLLSMSWAEVKRHSGRCRPYTCENHLY